MPSLDEKYSKLAERYIRVHPPILDTLRSGLINYTALAREIAKENKTSNVIAIAAACRRLKSRLSAKRGLAEEISKIIKSGKLLVRTNILIAFMDHPRAYEKIGELERLVRAKKGILNVIDGEESLAIITGREFKGEIRRIFGKFVQDIFEDLVQLSFVFPKRAVTTPGVASRLYASFSGSGINIYGELTSYGDHLIIIHERDLVRALALIRPEDA